MSNSIKIPGGGNSIEMGGWAVASSWGDSPNITSPILERPDGYSVQFQYCGTYGDYYGNGSFNAQFKGSDDGHSFTQIASSGAVPILSGGGKTSNKNNAYKYYQISVQSENPSRGMACMYLVKD